MPEPLADKIMQHIDQVIGLYHRLIIVAAPPSSGKTTALQHIQKLRNIPLINVNLELSKQLLDLTERQRALQLPRLLMDMIKEYKNDTILLDNIEILFDVSLKQDSLRLLRGLSRNRTVVATWGGSVMGKNLIYATPDHPEYKKYPTKECIIISPEA